MRYFWAVLSVICLATAARADALRMAVTTSFHNSGLSDILLPMIKADTGIDLRLLVVGTGQALRLGASGDVDAILVHSRAAEEAFVAEGNASYRREIMYNDFILVGPKADPAGITGAQTAAEALARIAKDAQLFVSRGDDSGTHKKEMSLWLKAGIVPDGPWYKAVGAGMGAALNTAAGLDAYILADRASWLNFGNKAGLARLFEGDLTLFNQYAFLPISAQKHPYVKRDLTRKLETWLVSDKAAAAINDYRIQGQNLFVFNAKKK